MKINSNTSPMTSFIACFLIVQHHAHGLSWEGQSKRTVFESFQANTQSSRISPKFSKILLIQQGLKAPAQFYLALYLSFKYEINFLSCQSEKSHLSLLMVQHQCIIHKPLYVNLRFTTCTVLTQPSQIQVSPIHSESSNHLAEKWCRLKVGSNSKCE